MTDEPINRYAEATDRGVVNIARIARHIHAHSSWCAARDLSAFIQHLKNEVQELEEALQEGDTEGVYEELGDVVFGAFRLLFRVPPEERPRVLDQVSDKLVFRYPSLFEGEMRALNPEDLNAEFLARKEIAKQRPEKAEGAADRAGFPRARGPKFQMRWSLGASWVHEPPKTYLMRRDGRDFALYNDNNLVMKTKTALGRHVANRVIEECKPFLNEFGAWVITVKDALWIQQADWEL